MILICSKPIIAHGLWSTISALLVLMKNLNLTQVLVVNRWRRCAGCRSREREVDVGVRMLPHGGVNMGEVTTFSGGPNIIVGQLRVPVC